MALHALKVGYHLGEYRIEKLLGEGGFGLTYLAFDTHLAKQVAIKEYMPSEHAIRSDDTLIIAKSKEADQVYQWGLKAFVKEAQILAKFKNPNIVTIHRFFEANGTAYIVMEYCAGQCLIDRVKQPLPETEVKRIVCDLVNGLQLVHKAGILHRDIKPDNIMFRKDGTPVLIDFGAARQAIGEKNRKMTTIVTPGYAPLEQYSNKGSVGPWSDIYSLSAVAYLCLTAKKPPDIMNRLHDDDIILLNQKLGPSDFLKAIDQGLSIQVNERPRNLKLWSQGWCQIQHADEDNEAFAQQYHNTKPTFMGNLARAKTTKLKHFPSFSLKWLVSGSLIFVVALFLILKQPYLSNNSTKVASSEAHISNNMIAVLPLVNTKNEQDIDYLGFALADQIIGQLSYFKQVNVRPTSSIRRFNHKDITPQEVGEILKVNYVLSGHYLKVDESIRLNFELIETSTQQLIWHESLDFSYDNVFELQDKVAKRLSQKLGLGFTSEQLNHNDKTLPSNPIAYEYYLRSLSYPLTTEGDKMAVAMLTSAISLESNYAPSHVEIGRRLNRLAIYGLGSTEDFNTAKEHLLQALTIDPNSLSALRNLATFYTENGEILKALKMTQRMLKINPNHADAFFSIAYIYRYAGLLQESIPMVEKAIELDPNNMKYRTLGVNYYNLGQYQKALDVFKPITASPFGLLWLAFVQDQLDQKQEAISSLQQLIDMQAGDFYKYIAIANIAILTDEKEKGLNALKQLEKSDVHDAEALYYWASYYAKLGDQKNSLKLLKKAIDFGYFNVPFIKSDSKFDDLRKNSHYIELMVLAEQKHKDFIKATQN